LEITELEKEVSNNISMLKENKLDSIINETVSSESDSFKTDSNKTDSIEAERVEYWKDLKRRYDESVRKLPKQVKQLFPKDYSVINMSGDFTPIAKGDLNNDGRIDIAVVLSHKDESNWEIDMDSIPPRILMIFFSTKDGNYRKAISRKGVILCERCGGMFGDPFQEFKIENNVLSIVHYSGSSSRWGSTHKFKYISGDFYLVFKSEVNYQNNIAWCDKLDHHSNYNLQEHDYLSGKFSEYEVNEDCVITKNNKSTKKPKSLTKLKNFVFKND
jgi:hypothetical protein